MDHTASADTRGAWLRRWRVLAIDGFDIDLPDTLSNAAEFGYSGSGDSRPAYPKARVVALAECGTHAFPAAEVAGMAMLENWADDAERSGGADYLSISPTAVERCVVDPRAREVVGAAVRFPADHQVAQRRATGRHGRAARDAAQPRLSAGLRTALR